MTLVRGASTASREGVGWSKDLEMSEAALILNAKDMIASGLTRMFSDCPAQKSYAGYFKMVLMF